MSYSCIRVKRGGIEENVYYKDGQFVTSGYLPKSKIRNLKCREQKVIEAGPHNKKVSPHKSKSKKGIEKTNQDEMPIPKRGRTPVAPPKPNKSAFKKYQKKSAVKKSAPRKTPAKSKSSPKKTPRKSKGAAARKRAQDREKALKALDKRTKTKSRQI